MVEIIVGREQITPTWLSATLAAAGIEAAVVDLEVQPILAGYYGSSSRIVPRYEQDDETLPSSFFLKMATEHSSARERAAEGGMYRYEVGFYRQLATQVNIETPRCYAAEIADDNASFVLLLEDVAPFLQIDQLLGLSLAQSRLAVQELAGLHASTWQGRGMEECDWAKIDQVTIAAFGQSLSHLKSAFVERFGAEVSDENLEILHRLAEKGSDYWRYSFAAKNQAATHCDFRADNMLFGERGGELQMATIDWVGMLSGCGKDLGHFLGTSLKPELRHAHELELVSLYHETLRAAISQVGDTTDFSLKACVDDYRVNLLYPIYVVVSVTPSVNVDARGEKLFMSMFDRACEAIKESNALELIELL